MNDRAPAAAAAPPPAAQTFINKYKPQFIDDFHFGEDFLSMTRALIDMNFLNTLFVGNTGTCKTTFLHAIIREYYGLPAGVPLPAKNILFINNLREQGINYYRTELKIFCQSHSNIRGKNKIIVMDDIDTMNEQSQQVFRNCIDKYGHNVFFLATCSNIQKVIESIQSRLQIVKVPPFTREHLRDIMDRICAVEGIVMDARTCDFLLNISNYSIRVLVNYLEKIHLILPAGGAAPRPPATFELCNKLCTDISFETFEKYTECVAAGDLTGAVRIFYEICDYGYSVIDIFDNYFLFIKTAATAILTEEQKYRMIPFLCKYITAFHNIHEDPIELALFTNNVWRGVFAGAGAAAAANSIK